MAVQVALYTTELWVYTVTLFLKCNNANCLDTFKCSHDVTSGNCEMNLVRKFQETSSILFPKEVQAGGSKYMSLTHGKN